MGKIEEIKKLSTLLNEGAITQDEFNLLKKKILDSDGKSNSSIIIQISNENKTATDISKITLLTENLDPQEKTIEISENPDLMSFNDDVSKEIQEKLNSSRFEQNPVKEKMSSKTKICPFCGEEIKEIAIKCWHCHEMLYDLSTENQVSTIKCPFCAEIIISTETICPQCRSSLSEKNSQPPNIKLFIPRSWEIFKIGTPWGYTEFLSGGGVIIIILFKLIPKLNSLKNSDLIVLQNYIESFLLVITSIMLFTLVRFMKRNYKEFISLKFVAWIYVLFTFLNIYVSIIDTDPVNEDQDTNIIGFIILGIFCLPSLIAGLHLSKIYNDVSGGLKSLGIVF